MPLPTSFSGRLYEALVASVAVLRAKTGNDTLFITQSGENLIVPRATAHGAAAWIGEGVLITESDPTLSSITLGAFGAKGLLDISYELVQDEGFDIVGYAARAMGRNCGLLAGAGYVVGVGATQPTGFQPNVTVGVTGPTGTTTTLGTQATAGQGSDLLVDLFYSIIDLYRANGTWIMNDATVAKVARLKGTNGETIWLPGIVPGAPDTLLGRPILTDPNMPVMAANAKSIAFGDFNGYGVRIVRGVRFERSDHAKFENDLISFKAVLRTDGKLVDTGAIKVFQNSAT
jgi:HK97 family phage major capsid protein